MRVPDAEQVTAARCQYPVRVAIGFFLVREKHHTELANHGVECLVGERQCGRIGALKFQPLARCELGARDIEHWRVQVGRHDLRFGRQKIA